MIWLVSNSKDREVVSVKEPVKYCIILALTNGGLQSNVNYVSSWSFENGLGYTSGIQQAAIYTVEQAEHIIKTEMNQSSTIRANIKFETVSVVYGLRDDSVSTTNVIKDGPSNAWSLWMDNPEFDMEDFEKAMSNPSNFEPYRNEQLTEPNQMFIVTHHLRAQLRLVVSFPGHITEEDYQSLREGYKFGFNNVKVEYLGEGAASFSVFTFTL